MVEDMKKAVTSRSGRASGLGKSDRKRAARKSDSARAAARRMLLVQYGIFTANLAGVIRGESSLHLHDFRVAVRRFRALLRIFKKPLADTSASRLYTSYTELCSRLGPFRDSDVWMDFLEAAACQPRIDRRSLGTMLRDERANRERGMKELRVILGGREWQAVRRATMRLLNVELAGPEPRDSGENIRPFAAREMKKQLQRLDSASYPGDRAAPEEIHELRKICRRARYCAEFFAPVLGEPVRKLAQRLKNITTSLGALHDIDAYEKRLAGKRSRAAAGLRRLLRRQSAKSRDLFKRNWRELRNGKFRKRLPAAAGKTK